MDLKIFFYIYHLGQDLAWDWISASYLIKYVHTGRSCDLLIFGIPEVNFLVRAFQFGMKGVLSRIYDISPGVLLNSNICIFPKFFTCFLINPHRLSMSGWSWSQYFIFAWDVTAGGILRTGVLICLVYSYVSDDTTCMYQGSVFVGVFIIFVIKIWPGPNFCFTKLLDYFLNNLWYSFHLLYFAVIVKTKCIHHHSRKCIWKCRQ